MQKRYYKWEMGANEWRLRVWDKFSLDFFTRCGCIIRGDFTHISLTSMGAYWPTDDEIESAFQNALRNPLLSATRPDINDLE